jgi:hypothetical protein
MFAGILGTWELLKNIRQAVYVNDRDRASAVTINVCNKTGTDGKVSIAISSSATSVAASEWIIFNADLLARQTFEKMGVLVPAGKYVVVKTNLDNCNAVVYGAVTGESITVAGITQNLGTAPSWATASSLPVIFSGDPNTSIQLEAIDEEGETLSYSALSSLPSSLTLSSSGLISGTPDASGYFSGIPDSSSTVDISATDSRNNSSTRAFTITKRWADGSTSALAAPSASVIKTVTGTTTDGVYWIKGRGSSSPQQIYCIMDNTVDGGGWMAVANNGAQSAALWNSGHVPRMTAYSPYVGTNGANSYTATTNFSIDLKGWYYTKFLWQVRVTASSFSLNDSNSHGYFYMVHSNQVTLPETELWAWEDVRPSSPGYSIFSVKNDSNPSGLSNKRYYGTGRPNTQVGYGVVTNNLQEPKNSGSGGAYVPFLIWAGGEAYGPSGATSAFGFSDQDSITATSGRAQVRGFSDWQNGAGYSDTWGIGTSATTAPGPGADAASTIWIK